MSETVTKDSIPLSAFKAFEATEGGTCLTRGKVVMQAFRAVQTPDGNVGIEVEDGDSSAALVVSREDARRLAGVLLEAAG